MLEIGTGSGYQAAILARLARHVRSVEILPELAAQARRVLEELGYAVAVTTGACPRWFLESTCQAFSTLAVSSTVVTGLLMTASTRVKGWRGRPGFRDGTRGAHS